MDYNEFKKKRQSLGLSQEALADKIGRTKSIISQWESGHVELPMYAKLLLEEIYISKGRPEIENFSDRQFRKKLRGQRYDDKNAN